MARPECVVVDNHIASTGDGYTLVDHGILTEDSDYRMHFSTNYSKAAIFPTASGREVVRAYLNDHMVDTSTYELPVVRLKDVGNRPTAVVVYVQVDDIPGARLHDMSDADLAATQHLSGYKRAEAIAVRWWRGRPATRAEQLLGFDVISKLGTRVEVKHDRRAPGEVALQTHERRDGGYDHGA